MVQLEKDRRILGDRRQKPTKPSGRSIFSGRRRSVRRRADRKTYLYVDLYSPHLLLSLLIIILLSVFDAYFTIFHVEDGAREINPFMSFLIGYGNIYFFTIKYVLTALGLFILCIYKNSIIARILILIVFFLYLGVFVNHVYLILVN